MKEKGCFAEWACVYKHYYGTPLDQIYQFWNEGKLIIKDLDLQGAELIKKRFPSTVRVFIHPPSLDSLVERIHKRRSHSDRDVWIRSEKAQWEIEGASKFDHQIVNNIFPETFEKLKKIIESCLKMA